VKARKVTQIETSYLIRNPVSSDCTLFNGKNMPLRAQNIYLGN